MADNYPLDNAELTPETREETFLDGVTELEPETRKEAFIAKIYDSSQVVPEHIETREEWFLNKAAEGGGGVTIEALSVTENGTYSEAGKAYSPVTVNVPYDFDKKSLTNQPVASFDDAMNAPLYDLDIDIEPVQDLHGYANPWVGGAGKNKCPINSGTITVGDFVTFDTPLPSGTYSFSLKATRTPSSNSYASLVPYDKDGVAYTNVIGIAPSQLDGSDLKAEAKELNNGISKIYIYSIAGNWSDSRNYTLSISDLQIEQGSTATSFAPYSNICPISGHTEANVTACGETYNISFEAAGTVYGGTLNVLTGELVVTHANIASYNGETINEPWISSMDVYSAGATPTTGAQVVYPLATPQTYQLTPEEIKTIFDQQNNIYADTGNVANVTYLAVANE